MRSKPTIFFISSIVFGQSIPLSKLVTHFRTQREIEYVSPLTGSPPAVTELATVEGQQLIGLPQEERLH